MSTGKRILPAYSVITNGDMSAATIQSSTTNVQNLDVVSYQISWTTGAVGTLAVYASGDGVTFEPLQNFAINSPNNSASGTWVDIQQCGAFYMYLLYTKTSGTGTLNAKVCGKAF
jgi:hypothetical protein